MSIEKSQEMTRTVRDGRTVDRKFTDFLTSTPMTIGSMLVMGTWALISPWILHIFLPIGLIWYVSVIGNVQRQVLPYYLPRRANRKDYNLPRAGAGVGFEHSQGIIYLGNAVDRYKEVWETSSAARQHHLVFGTTGAGKSEALTGLYANYILLGAGCIFSDAKGTPEQISKLYRIARRFGRDVDYFNLFYGTGGQTIRAGSRERLSNRANPCSHASADSLNNLFLSFLPASSGDNQIFQDRAIQMFTAVTPSLVDLRDLGNRSLNIPKISRTISSLESVIALAQDKSGFITDKSRNILKGYLSTLQGFDVDKYIPGDKDHGTIDEESYRMFSYAQNYFTRALSSLSNTYGHIYDYEEGELDYIDAVKNRRIVVISLPALEKAGAELRNLAKINLANLRGAIAYTAGNKVEGKRKEVLDNLASTSETPTGLILDEYGYQATEGFAITMAQARSLGFSITVAGQDFSNLKVSGDGDESDAIYGNAVLITLPIRNTKELGDRIRDAVGEADVAVESGLEKKAGVVSGYMSRMDVSIQRRYRITASDLLELNTGQAYMFVGRNIGSIKFLPWAPLPEKSDEYVISRFCPITFDTLDLPPELKFAKAMDALLLARIEGRDKSTALQEPHTTAVGGLLRAAVNVATKDGRGYSSLTASDWIAACASFVRVNVEIEKRAAARMASAASAQAPAPVTGAPPPPAPSAGAPSDAETARARATLQARVDAARAASAGDASPQPATPPTPSRPAASLRPTPPPVSASFGTPAIDEDASEGPDAWDDGRGETAPTRRHRVRSEKEHALAADRSLDLERDEDYSGDIRNAVTSSRLSDSVRAAAQSQRTLVGGDIAARSANSASAAGSSLVSGLEQAATYTPPRAAPTASIGRDALLASVGRLRDASMKRIQTTHDDAGDDQG